MRTSSLTLSRLPLSIVAALACLPACGGDDDGIDPDAVVLSDVSVPDAAQDDVAVDMADDTSADADLGEDAAPLNPPLGVTVTRVIDGVTEPAAGAIVTVDFGDDQRIEATLDETGRVEFDDPTLADEARTISAFALNCRFETRFDVTPDEVEVELALPCYVDEPPPDAVVLSGQATMLDPAHYLLVSASAAPRYSQMVGPDWSLDVAPDTPFDLVALEFSVDDTPEVSARGTAQNFIAWTSFKHPGVAEDTAIDLDMNDADVPTRFETTVPLPGPDSLWHGAGRPYLITRHLTSALSLGFPSIIDINPDGTAVDIVGEYLDVVDPSEVFSYYSISTQLASGPTVRAAVTHRGYPGEALEVTFPDPPYVSEPPPDGGGPHGLHEELRWQLGPGSDDLEVFVYVWNNDLSQFIWYAPLAPGTTAITFPELPAGIDRGAVFGQPQQPVVIAVQHCARIPDFAPCTRWATSRFFRLIP